jgi:hypothetical protein
MRHGAFVLLAFGMVLAATITVRGGDSTAARALVEKAIEAQGGEAKLSKFAAVTASFKGTFHGLGEAAPLTGELASQGADRQKTVMEMEAGGEKLRIVHVLNRDKGWTKINDDLEELDADDLAEAKEEAHVEWVATLVPLKDRTFQLATVSEVRIDKRPALGVRVSSKGRRDVTLYFDKESGLLVKSESRVKDDDNQEVTEETFFSAYKEVQGTKQAMRFTVKRDGKLYLEGEFIAYRLVEKLDDKVFAKP